MGAGHIISAWETAGDCRMLVHLKRASQRDCDNLDLLRFGVSLVSYEGGRAVTEERELGIQPRRHL